MPNHIPAVEAIKKDMRLGWPDGIGHLHRVVPALLQRIEELERTLAPFARVYALNANTNLPMVYCHWTDCKAAHEMLDESQGVQPRRDDFFDNPV